MSDLISRSEVNDTIDELEVYTCGRPNTMKVEISVLQLQRLINKLKNIPTAYDIDKVVEELETDSSVKLYGSQNSDNYMIQVKRAIEIVKQGDVSDDVCKWKDKELYGYYTSCTEFRSCIACKDTYWKYCPYCGKKIKIVGD